LRNPLQVGKQVAKHMAKKVLKAALKKVLVILAPLFISLLPVIVAILAAIILLASVYGSMPHDQSLTGIKPSEQDAVIRNVAQQEVAENNVRETWLVDSNTRIGYLADRYGSDVKLINKWGDVYSPALYKAMQTFEENKMSNLQWSQNEIKKLAYDLRPFFDYKKSTITVCGEEGCESNTVYLLVEANTIRGHYKYTYEWVSETSSNGVSVRYERLKDVVLVGEKWERLENYLKDYLDLQGETGKKDAPIVREMVFNAGEGFTMQQEWLNWLNSVFGGSAAWASGAMIPAELRPYFEEAAQRFGIPSWFLAAVAMKESTFNPTAVGQDGTGSYGLMQVLPDNWNKYAPLLGFDVYADKDNSRAQVLVGAYMLASYGIHVNWDGDNWKEESLPMLVCYNAGAGKLGNKTMEEYVRKNYAEVVWEYAERFKAPVTWPVPGYTEISSGFGMRFHPILGQTKSHNGIDIAAPEGAQVISVSGGIAYVGYEAGGFGNYVVVKDSTYEYYYAHLSSVSVANGQQVTPGMEIGLVGSTGLSSGPHLHFGLKPLDSGQWIDPLLILNQ